MTFSISYTYNICIYYINLYAFKNTEQKLIVYRKNTTAGLQKKTTEVTEEGRMLKMESNAFYSIKKYLPLCKKDVYNDIRTICH